MTEHDIQCIFMSLVHYQLREYSLIYAVPNGGARSPVTGARLKKEGVKRGIPDVNIDHPRSGYHGMRIEFKVPGGKPTEHQKKVIAYMNAEGYLVRIHTDPHVAFSELKSYLEGTFVEERNEPRT
jgi:hypothetical protein